jgi:hypothetical protein
MNQKRNQIVATDLKLWRQGAPKTFENIVFSKVLFFSASENPADFMGIGTNLSTNFQKS